jgi:hypothetical protein
MSKYFFSKIIKPLFPRIGVNEEVIRIIKGVQINDADVSEEPGSNKSKVEDNAQF